MGGSCSAEVKSIFEEVTNSKQTLLTLVKAHDLILILMDSDDDLPPPLEDMTQQIKQQQQKQQVKQTVNQMEG